MRSGASAASDLLCGDESRDEELLWLPPLPLALPLPIPLCLLLRLNPDEGDDGFVVDVVVVVVAVIGVLFDADEELDDKCFEGM